MAEISQLLSQYQQQLNQDGGSGQRSNQPVSMMTASSNITSMLVSALNNLPRNQNGGKSKPSAKLSPRSNPPKKPTTQKPSTSATKDTHHEVKTEGPKKTDKKTVAVKPQKNKFWK
ncbi:hypothetical protein LOTGIDRAFT_171578 [Lottia gigantea]|uniref:Uncharacterized protein n=1 Tax=Lottia gigantea TaxID=225164 RepID=V4AZR9_LOTGI|nr:hypothetical protein LOTGIDRAFT_171578 [Lottia gigantea]ESP03228.1 hypothetical protein LOTGIDRAFT_171578 [Lottia gigantea]